MAGRRAGKTEAVIKKICTMMVIRRDASIVYVAKTLTVGIEQVFNGVLSLLEELGLDISERRRNEGYIKTADGGTLYIRGNSSTEEREKLRGFRWDLAIIDECQSQTALPYLINDVLGPALQDRKGSLVLAGTGPRVRGTYWELLWTEGRNASRYNWNLTENLFIDDSETVLDRIKEEKGLTDSSPLFVREYLGKIAYDDDALVYRLKEDNYYTWEQVKEWINGQPRSDIVFTGGLDFGFVDSDALALIMYSKSRPERFLIWEWKQNRIGTAEMAAAIKEGILSITPERFAEVPDRSVMIYGDSAGQTTIYDLSTTYGLPIYDAYKADKDFAIEHLQDEVRRGLFKVPKGGIFADEALKTIFARNDRDELTREVDDDTYHPDLLDAVLYAMRPVWLFTEAK